MRRKAQPLRGEEPLRGETVAGELAAPELGALPRGRLRAMLLAGAEALECQRVLSAGGINLVSEVLRGEGEFVEYDHYPSNDVYDPESGAQYYYHAHRGNVGEHGHFHTFLRWSSGQPPVPAGSASGVTAGEAESVTHLIAISMDSYGWPAGLFAINRWVCGGAWRSATQTIDILPRFRIDHAYPSWPVNRWLGAMMVLFWPHIEALLNHRDAVIGAWKSAHPDRDALEDRKLEVTGYLPISVEETVSAVRELAGMRSPIRMAARRNGGASP